MVKSNEKLHLTQIEMSCCSVTEQFGFQFCIVAVHFNSLRVELYGVIEFLLFEFIITFIIVHLCYR